MKLKIILVFLLSLSFFTEAFAQQEVSRSLVFRYLGEKVLTTLPKSYHSIALEYVDVSKNDKNYENLQKLVYLDLIDNKKAKVGLSQKLNAYLFYSMIEKIVDYDFITDENKNSLQKRNTFDTDLIAVEALLQNQANTPPVNTTDINTLFTPQKAGIFNDVYNTLVQDHYNSVNIKKDDLIYGAIEGLTKGSQDKFTTFFPPQDNQTFQESLSGEFEGIGAYIDIEKAGEPKIVSPIAGSPAEKAGLKSGDIILQIDDYVVEKNVLVSQISAKIKGPAGTKVKLLIQRGTEKMTIEVTRAKITINDVEYKKIDNTTFYIQMKMFGEKVFTQMQGAIGELKKDVKVKKVIIDLRNNPGGYLDQAVDILSMFIQKGYPVALVKYKNGQSIYNSYGYDTIDLSTYQIYILANSGTASASEIMIGTLKDYFPNITIIGEKTYGKGSVQTMKAYLDGSMLKYTIAKWYTGKTFTGIDGVGISPDTEVKLDEEKFKSGTDTQLDYILKQ